MPTQRPPTQAHQVVSSVPPAGHVAEHDERRTPNDVTAAWRGRPSTLAGLGIPRAAGTRTDLYLPDAIRQRYQAPTYFPRGFHSRFLQDWQAIPCWTHSAGSEFTPCPCGCRPHGLGEFGLRNKGALTLLVRTPQGARLPAPEEIAQAMGFPPHAFWETVAPRLGLALLGNAISPLHGVRALGKLSIMCAMLQQSPLPADYIALTTDRILRLADHGPAKVVTTPTSAPASAPKDLLPHEPGTGLRTGAAHTEEVELQPRQIVVSSVAITVVTPGPNLIWVGAMDDRTMTDFKAVLHLLGHLLVLQGTFALGGRPFLDHTPLCLAGIQNGSVVALLPDLDKPLPCPPPPLSPQGGLQSAAGGITRLFPGTLADVYELTLYLYTGADGNVDVQASHDTPVESLLEHAAGLAGIPAVDVAILHSNAGSLEEHGPNISHVPGFQD